VNRGSSAGKKCENVSTMVSTRSLRPVASGRARSPSPRSRSIVLPVGDHRVAWRTAPALRTCGWSP
jgi:hypothetical protein